MNKYLFLLLITLSYTTKAQMTDLLGSLAIQGTMTQQSAQSVNAGISSLNRTQILQDLQQSAMEIKTRYFGNYTKVNKNSVMGHPFPKIDWTAGSVGSSKFFIQLNQIDNSTCNYLNSGNSGALEVQINGSGTCSDKNTMKFIFD